MRSWQLLITSTALQVRRCGEAWSTLPHSKPKLSPGDTITIKGDTVPLAELSQALILYEQDWLNEYLDERGQIEVGHYLYEQIFGTASPYDLTEDGEGAEVRIVTEDEDIARLPWVLIAYNGVFLSAMKWAVSLATDIQTEHCELPPRPKILVAAPQPDEREATEAEEHLQDFRNLLTAADFAYGDDSRFKIVTNLPSFLDELDTFRPDILYYYGHGIGNQHTTRLLFTDRKGRAVATPLPDLVAALHILPEHERPKLAYINCCQGDSGGLLGVGRQLLNLIPAVLTNRTIAHINAARPQALDFFEAVLLRGEAPHAALSATQARLGGLGLSTADIRWMTPVLHCRYDQWRASPPVVPGRSRRDPNWRLKVDRVNQFSKVFYQTHQMLMERKPRGLAYLWYGTPDQGLEVFHRRLSIELQEKLNDTLVYKITPEWPDDLLDPDRSFKDRICQAFDVESLEHIPGRIRSFSRGISGSKVLVYLCHRPLESRYILDPKNIRLYLDWWNKVFLPLLPKNAHALLGISYHAKKPASFYNFLVKKEKLDDFPMSHAVVELLDELERVTRRDLIDFIRTHSIAVPTDLRDKAIDEILARSNGSYVRVLDELEHLESQIWRQGIEERGAEEDEDDDGL